MFMGCLLQRYGCKAIFQLHLVTMFLGYYMSKACADPGSLCSLVAISVSEPYGDPGL